MNLEFPDGYPSARLRRRVGDGCSWDEDVACAFAGVRASNAFMAFAKLSTLLLVEITAFPGTGRLLLRHGALDVVGVTECEFIAVYSAFGYGKVRTVERWREPLADARPARRGVLFGVVYAGDRRLYVPRRQHRDLVEYLWGEWPGTS